MPYNGELFRRSGHRVAVSSTGSGRVLVPGRATARHCGFALHAPRATPRRCAADAGSRSAEYFFIECADGVSACNLAAGAFRQNVNLVPSRSEGTPPGRAAANSGDADAERPKLHAAGERGNAVKNKTSWYTFRGCRKSPDY